MSTQRFAQLYQLLDQSLYQNGNNYSVQFENVVFADINDCEVLSFAHEKYAYACTIVNQQCFTFTNKNLAISTNRNFITVLSRSNNSKVTKHRVDLNKYQNTETYFLTGNMVLDVKEHLITISQKGKIFLSYCFIPASDNYYHFFNEEDDDSYMLVELYDDLKYNNVACQNFSLTHSNLQYELEIRPHENEKSFTSKAKPIADFTCSLSVSQNDKINSYFAKVDYLLQGENMQESAIELNNENDKFFYVVKVDELKNLVKITLSQNYEMVGKSKTFTLNQRILSKDNYYVSNNTMQKSYLNQKVFFTSLTECINQIEHNFDFYYNNVVKQ